MNKEEYERVSWLFEKALPLSPPERERFLTDACQGTPSLRAEVDSLLELNERAEDAFPLSPTSFALDHDILQANQEVTPDAIGPYRILDVAGQGGMGIVYRAEQSHPDRTVALKVMRSGLDGPSSLHRFDYEVAVLGKLHHPGIAHIFDAGSYDGGGGPQPYFAMEWIEGISLLEYANEQRDNPNQILRTFSKICQAVEHAHQKGVIHRDLKPGNILVDESGQPKILDFGIAKATDVDLQAATMVTQAGQLLGTLDYMSPEQATGRTEELDTRSDVYSLGVILYEIFADELPYPIRNRPIHEAIELIRDWDAPLLGTFDPNSKGDIETIVSRALRKERSQRYQSAAALAADIQRYLHDEPILARPPSRIYILRKLAKRHSGLAFGMVGIFITLIFGLALSLWFGQAARRETQKVLGLSDQGVLADLRQQADILWPRRPELVGAMRDWVRQARELTDHIDAHEDFLADLVESTSENPDTRQAWLSTKVRELVEDLKVFGHTDPARGLIADVEARIAWALRIRRQTVEAFADRWSQALCEIAKHPRYDGLSFSPIVGLVPLGSNPQSNLHEFWLLESGEEPQKSKEDGSWIVDEDTGIVLVLVPGGSFFMGASTDPKSVNCDPHASEDEGPVHEVTLSPFFLSKYEMTQGQWLRIMGSNPSIYQAGHEAEHEGLQFSLAHPIETVSWQDANRAARRLGLTLPTEAQWEYATRGGTNTPWWTGLNPGLLAKAANFADLAYRDGGGDLEFMPWDDGHPFHAPVGSFEPNPFGFHDVHGNVWEWCGDPFGSYELPWSEGTGARQVAQPLTYSRRGGSFYFVPRAGRSADRFDYTPEHRYYSLGFRPALQIPSSP